MKFDIRVNLALAVLSSLLYIFLQSEVFFALAITISTIFLLLENYLLKAIKILLLYLIFYYMTYSLFASPFFRSFGLFTDIFRHLLLPISFMLGGNRSTGEILTVFKRLHLPKVFGVSVIVLLRYMPTISFEIKNIRTALKYRGVGISFFNVLSHPLKNFKYTLIPLLMRTIHISEELTAAAMVRGVEMNNEIVSYDEVKFRKIDGLVLILFSIFVLILIPLEKYYMLWYC